MEPTIAPDKIAISNIIAIIDIFLKRENLLPMLFPPSKNYYNIKQIIYIGYATIKTWEK
jgi:hypothetical protein